VAVLVVASAVVAAVFAWTSRRLAGYEPPAIAARVVRYALPVALIAANPIARIQSFIHPPATLTRNTYIESHLLSTNGSWRWQLWHAALNEFWASPLIGKGAGSFEAWWSQYGREIGFVGNAHSLYFETLGDLGLIGLCLLVGAFVTVIVVAVRRTLALTMELRESAAAVTAAFIAYAIAAGVDWMWELPIVSMVRMGLLAFAVGPATEPVVEQPVRIVIPPELLSRRAVQARRRLERRRMRRRRTLRLVAATVAVAAIASEADLYATNASITESQTAAARGDLTAARADAVTARTFEPWAATPYLQLALVEEKLGRLHVARRRMEQAIARDGRDWRLWLVATRIETDLGEIRAAEARLANVRQLNPRSPAIASIDLKNR
jgi:O-antigen ligase/polysaccharide polymerase Wzy-like membrane protein